LPAVKLNGVDTYYQVDGNGTRTFFLFNGAGCTTRTWDELAPELIKLGSVVRFDARGAGQTSASTVPYTLKTLADDGLALMDHLGIPAPIVLAHAFGGRVAQVFTRDYPHRTRALIFCGTGGLYPPLPVQNQQGPPSDIQGRVEMWLATFFGSQFRTRHPERATRIINDFISQLKLPRAGSGPSRQLLQMEPAESYWGKVADTIPTLLVYGTEDKFGHEKNARDLAQRIKNSKLVFIEGAGHMAIQEEPERIGSEISEFIEENGL
jgi:pimeloyl-ACP methyl ester carboxylesterase